MKDTRETRDVNGSAPQEVTSITDLQSMLARFWEAHSRQFRGEFSRLSLLFLLQLPWCMCACVRESVGRKEEKEQQQLRKETRVLLIISSPVFVFFFLVPPWQLCPSHKGGRGSRREMESS